MGIEGNIGIRKECSGDIETVYAFERQYIIEQEPEAIESWDAAEDSIKGH